MSSRPGSRVRRSGRPGHRRWVPVLLYIGLIFALSSIRRPPPSPDVPQFDKLLHLAEYAMLGFLTMRARSATTRGPWRQLLGAVLIGGLVGVLDELYQSTVPGRQATGLDVAADVVGVTVGAVAWRRLSAPRR